MTFSEQFFASTKPLGTALGAKIVYLVENRAQSKNVNGRYYENSRSRVLSLLSTSRNECDQFTSKITITLGIFLAQVSTRNAIARKPPSFGSFSQSKIGTKILFEKIKNSILLLKRTAQALCAHARVLADTLIASKRLCDSPHNK